MLYVCTGDHRRHLTENATHVRLVSGCLSVVHLERAPSSNTIQAGPSINWMVDVSAHYFWHATPSWRKWTALEEDKLSRPHHIITRFALNTPFRPNQPGYVSYHDRCQMLGVINFQLRQVRLSAQFLYKVMTEATHTTTLQFVTLFYPICTHKTSISVIKPIGLPSMQIGNIKEQSSII